MNHFLCSKFIIWFHYLLQIILLACGIYLLTSKIPILPWSSPLTTYVLLYLLILLGLQCFLFLLYWRLYDHHPSYLTLFRIAFLHLLSLLLMCLLSIMSIPNFIRGCIFFSITNFYLTYLIFRSLKFHIKA